MKLVVFFYSYYFHYKNSASGRKVFTMEIEVLPKRSLQTKLPTTRQTTDVLRQITPTLFLI